MNKNKIKYNVRDSKGRFVKEVKQSPLAVDLVAELAVDLPVDLVDNLYNREFVMKEIEKAFMAGVRENGGWMLPSEKAKAYVKSLSL